MLRCADNSDNSHPMSLLEIHQEYHDEYEELSKEEKEELIKEFTDEKDGLKNVRQPTARGRLQDALNVVRNMQQLVSLLFYS
jgi:pyruvate-formate lyase-activating enzyme